MAVSIDAPNAMLTDTTPIDPGLRAEAPPATVAAPRVVLGLRGKLFMAFGAIAFLTVVGSLVGFAAFKAVEERLSDVVDDALPTMTLTRQLSEHSAVIVAGAPMLQNATSQDQRAAIRSGLDEQGRQLVALIDTASGRNSSIAMADMQGKAPEVVDNLAALNKAVESRLNFALQREKAVAGLAATHRKFLDAITPLTERTSSALRASGERLGKTIDKAVVELSDHAANDLIAAFELQNTANRLSSLLLQINNAKTEEEADSVWQGIPSTAIGAMGSMKRFETNEVAQGIVDPLKQLLAYAIGGDSLYNKRKEYLGGPKTAAGSAEFDKIGDDIKDLTGQVNAAVSPLVAGTRARIVVAASELRSESKEAMDTLLNTELSQFRTYLELNAQGNLLAGMLGQAANLPNARLVNSLHTDFSTAVDDFAQKLTDLPSTDAAKALAEQAMILLTYGKDGEANNIFAIRIQELAQRDQGATLLNANRELVKQLADDVAAVVKESEAAASGAAEATRGTIARGRLSLGAIAAISVLAAIAIAWLYVGRVIVRRMIGLANAMRQVAAGDLDTPMPKAGRDEIADMVRSLTVFRDTAREVRSANEEAAAARLRAETERRETLLGIAESLERSVKGVVDAVSQRAGELHGTASEMVNAAGETQSEAGNAGDAANQASDRVQTVAAAAEQLSGSILEIGRQVTRSAEIASQAVIEAQQTDETVQNLNEAASKIREVVDLISQIADQTNLLALNATIEAARAGEAGKGFAVVASEVKNLATQTAKATDQISQQIAAMQTASTNAVEAIRRIATTITGINEISTAISSAVEQQGAATREIAQNVAEAAAGTSLVSQAIGNVSQVASKTGSAAEQMLTASGELTTQAETLTSEVGKFLSEVRAG